MKSLLFTAILSLRERSEQILIKFAILLQVRLTHAQTFFRGVGLHNLSSSIFFHYSTLWVLKESIYNKTLIPRAVFAKLRAISNYFFDTPCIVETKSNPNLQVSLD
jgi:hypothetical protein